MSCRPLLPVLFIGTLLCCFKLEQIRSDAANLPVDFSRDIRPIFAEHCFACHGPDEKARKAKLRLDVDGESFQRVLKSEPKQVSALLERITSTEVEHRMPPAKTGKTLAPAQVTLIKHWIEQGGKWSNHWAFVRPKRPTLPRLPVVAGHWPRNAIDHFILARLHREGLQPSPEADRATLLRRLSFDLRGLPPTADEVDAFLQDTSPGAHANAVERLLASQHFGERMAQHWLDLARFGDSDGYHDDTPRIMYPFRDYVIASFNRNKPFDQFTIEQLAGDQLPEATLEQKIGSAFHRCGPTSSEGGADAKEYLAKYAVDRVNTTATVWLGVTMQCAECHDHKYDPLTTREYYQLFAFFNQVPEDALFRGNEAPPVLPTPNGEQQRQLNALTQRIAELERELQVRIHQTDPVLDASQAAWEKRVANGDIETLRLSPWQAIGPFPAHDGKPPPFEFAYPPEEKVDLRATYDEGKLKWIEHPEWKDGKPYYLRGENCATYFHRTIHADGKQALTLYLGSDDGIKLWVNGKLLLSNILVRGVAPNQEKVSVVLEPGENHVLMKIVNLQGGYGFYFHTREKEKDEALEAAVAIAKKPGEQRDAHGTQTLRRFYRERFAVELTELRAQKAEAEQQKALLERAVPRLRIMADVPTRRPTHILQRGDFRKLGDEVQPGVPAVFHPLSKPAGGSLANRLDLARWIASPENPLTARVVVNRFWQMIFGQGLAKTVDDFGVRSPPPSHPELLDWLAVEFVESGWDVKHLLRLIVASATYRQSSRLTPELRERDPQNVLLARGPRLRLAAEAVRDNALAISGLLDRRIGGPSVKPYQPGDLWREFAYGDSADKSYQQDHGPDLYRRGLYVYWKRSIMHPAFAAFDAPNREVCVACRPVTNTPIQAFVTMNDVTYVEAARVFAERVLTDGGTGFAERLTYAYKRSLARAPLERERAVMARTHEWLRVHYHTDQTAARRLITAGEFPPAKHLDPVEHAAWTGLCQIILNLDETLTRE